MKLFMVPGNTFYVRKKVIKKNIWDVVHTYLESKLHTYLESKLK